MTRMVFRQKKTKGFEYLDISDQAVKYLGEQGKPDERVSGTQIAQMKTEVDTTELNGYRITRSMK